MADAKAAWTFRPALQLMGGRLIGFAATFFVPIVLVRLFDQEAFGTYKQLFLIYTTLYALGQVGMAESLFYFLPLAPEKRGRYIFNSLVALALSGTVCFAVLWLARGEIGGWLNNPELVPLLPLLGLYLGFMLASAGLEIALMCRRRYLAATASYALSDILRSAFLVLPALLVPDLEWLMIGAVAFAGGRFLVQLVAFGRDLGGHLRPDRALLKQQLAYSLPFQLAVIVEIAQTNFHQYAVSYWFDAATFAVYAVGCLQIPLVDFAASSAGNVLMVGMGEAQKEGDAAAARQIWTSTTRKLALLLFPLVALLLLVADDLIPFFFTARYSAAVPIFMVWTGAVLLSVLQTDSALRVYAEVRTILMLNLVRLGLIAATIAWAVSAMGLVGAVVVTVLASLVAKGLALVRLRRRLDTGWKALLPWKDLLAVAAVSVAAAVPPALLRPELARGTFLTLAVLGVTYTATLLALLLAFGLLEEGELPAVARRLGKRIGRQPCEELSETRSRRCVESPGS